MTNYRHLPWRVNTPSLLKQIANSTPGAEIFKSPLQIFGDLLSEVGACAARLNDPELNALMCRLAIYEIADPYNPNYDAKRVDRVLKLAESEKRKAKKERNRHK
jgi:hypothetical protein